MNEAEHDVAPETVAAPKPPARRHVITWGAVTLAALVALVWTWWPAAEPESVTLVRSYLEAIRTGDVDKALHLAGVHPEGDSAAFLKREAIADDWTIEKVVLLADGYVNREVVEAVIATGDGRTATGRFPVTRDHEDGDWKGWRMENPLVRIVVPTNSLWYAEVNGIRIADLAPHKAKDRPTDIPGYDLLPGAYRFYSDVPGLLDVRDEPMLLMPGARDARGTIPTIEVVRPRDLRLTADGESRVQAAMNAYIDACAAHEEKSPFGCPFGVRDLTDDDHWYRKYRDASWVVESYPVVTAGTGGEALTIVDRELGHALFTATGEDTGVTAHLTVPCPIRTEGFEAGVLPDGSLVVVPVGYRYREVSGDGEEDWYRHTC